MKISLYEDVWGMSNARISPRARSVRTLCKATERAQSAVDLTN